MAGQQRPARQRLGPRRRPLPVRQGPDRPGLRVDEGPRYQGRQGRRALDEGPACLRHPAEPVGQRRPPGRLAGRRPVGPPRPQGRQGCPRPGRPDLRAPSSARALAFLSDQVLSDKAFAFSPALLRRLGTEKWYHWGSDGGVGRRFPDPRPRPGDPEDRPGPVPRPGDPDPPPGPGTPGRPRRRPPAALRSLPQPERRRLRRGQDAPGRRPSRDGKPQSRPNSPSRRSAATSSANTCDASRASPSPREAPGAATWRGYAFFAGAGHAPADARSLARLHLKEIAGNLDAALNSKDLALDDLDQGPPGRVPHRITQVLDARVDAGAP